MVEVTLLVFGAQPLPSDTHHTVQRVLQHLSSYHTTNTSALNPDTGGDIYVSLVGVM
jgi:hypothetical protein